MNHDQQPAHQPDRDDALWRPDEPTAPANIIDAPDNDTMVAAERRTEERPQIWVGSWLDYNNGILHGHWIDAARDDDAIWTDIHAMLAASPTTATTREIAEDWGIFDVDGFGPLRIGEQETVAWVGTVARGIAAHGLAFAAYADMVDRQDALDGFTDDYLGEWDSPDSYVEQMTDDLGYNQLLDQALPDSIRSYVELNTAALARDMQISGDIHVAHCPNGGVWIFHAP